MDDPHLFATIRFIADRYFDGHFTLLKFTTNWRLCFGTPPTPITNAAILAMPCDKTLPGVFVKALVAAARDEPERFGRE